MCAFLPLLRSSFIRQKYTLSRGNHEDILMICCLVNGVCFIFEHDAPEGVIDTICLCYAEES